eukprot:11259202-Prorocentrum_lima.AAC.1
MLLQCCTGKIAFMVRGSTLDVVDVSRYETDKEWVITTMVFTRWLCVLPELPPDLLVRDPLLVTNFFEGSAQSHAESA